MRPRHRPQLVVAAVALAFAFPGLTRAQTGSLRVIRVTPTADANPFQQISVTFDRPVAGSLDRAVDPSTILHIEPAVRGRLEWRDPVTIRLTPTATLAPGAQYTVTVANGFRAMDGSALSEPYTFTFRAHGPLLLAGSPVGSDNRLPDHVAPKQRFALVYSSPVALPVLTGTSYVELSATCGGEKVVRLEAVSQRPVESDDRMSLREAGGWNRDRSLDSLRRVVQLAPRSPLPRACTGLLVVPTEITDQGSRGSARWPFETYGDLKLTSLACSDSPVKYCPTGPLVVSFTNPVRGSEVAKRIRILPDTKFSIRDTSGEAMAWILEAKVKPRVSYAVIADTALRDVYGQPIRGNPAAGFNTTGFEPTIIHAMGQLLVEKLGFRTLAVQHVNVDTLVATIAPVPQELERKVLSRDSWRDDSLWPKLALAATVTRIPVRAGTMDHALITGIPFPTVDASRAKASPLFALRVEGHSSAGSAITSGATTVVQVTDLGIHAKIGMTEGAVWVTGVSDGTPRAGATIVLYDASGRNVATTRTNAQGLARFTNLGGPPSRGIDDPPSYSGFEGYVSAQLGADRAVVAINRWDPDLSPWRFNVSSAWEDERLPLAGAVFTERGIYRPTERVYAKAIVRSGSLGALRAPAAGDSIKWLFHDREEGMLREVTVPLSAFGTSDQSLELPATTAVGYYTVGVQVKRLGKWRNVAQTSYRVAEYRPPEFLVDVNRADSTGMPGGKLTAKLQARYLFGAPMGRAVVAWQARQTSLSPWEIEIPGLDGWYVGETGNWWDEAHDEESRVFASETDTLDSRGAGAYTATIPEAQKGRPSRITVEATVTDVNRQAVGANTSMLVFPAEFSIAAKPLGASYFWRVGTAQQIGVVAVRPDGKKVPGVAVQGTVVRREWHRVRREREGVSELVGEWVSDTVARCSVMTTDTTAVCGVTPKEGGIYVVGLAAKDRAGRAASTSFERWVVGPDWVPWSDETQFKMDVIPDRPRYAVGDTATVLFAAPFTNAEAWVTVEREGLIEQRRLRITSGSTTLKFPITEAYAPNAFVSILVARGRSAPPGSLDDDGRPTIRVGYAELRVTPEVKRLAVAIETEKPEYRPADSARVRVHVRDALSHGSKSEVTLWAVDEGVLSLTGYKTPDPIDLIYKERGLGLRLASNMTSVAPQIPEGEKGKREAGGGGGAAGAEILRSRFKTTAFFLGSIVTDADGNGVAVAKLPDNLTTFRIMAVAVTMGDRYGKGESSLLVTRPLLARQALPRFVREGDAFNAGAVINRRDGAAVNVSVRAAATGVNLRGAAERSATLAALRGSEIRFPFQTPRVGDSATFRFDVTDNQNADAVQVKIPIRPDFHPVTSTIAGMLSDTATVSIPLPAGLDQARSRLSLSVGVSPLTAVRGMYRALRVYPYDCSEQVISEAMPIIALYRLQPKGIDSTLGVDPRREIERAVAVLSSRQRSDGAIGYWSSTDWTTAWLSAYAGLVMLDARAAGIKVDTLVLSRLGDYLNHALHGTVAAGFTPVAYWYSRRDLVLRDQLSAVDFMSRAGRADVAAENELLRNAAQMLVEDRARLAEVLVRRGQMEPARRLMESAWSLVRVEGRKAVLPDSALHPFYFWSSVRPYAQLLMGTLAVDPNHSLIGPLAESVVEQGRAARGWFWTTQDFGAAASALAALERRRHALGDRSVRVAAGKHVILDGARDSSVALQGLVTRQSGQDALQLSLQASPGEGSVYYFLSVTQIPSSQPVTPEEHGLRVERWYERFDTGNPTTSVAEGDLVRVRLRLTVPTTRTFVVLDDALPAGLEAVDLSLRTAAAVPGPGVKPADEEADKEERAESETGPFWYGSWDSGWWSPFDHRELRDDRVVYSASMLWPGTYTATYIARATTPGTFIKPTAHAEEMYNPAVYGRSDGGTFVVTPRGQ